MQEQETALFADRAIAFGVCDLLRERGYNARVWVEEDAATHRRLYFVKWSRHGEEDSKALLREQVKALADSTVQNA